MAALPRILVVDESPRLFPRLKDTLEMDGYQVDLVRDGKDWTDPSDTGNYGMVLVETGRLTSLIDRTNKLEEENQRLSKLAEAKGQYIRLVTHELKSPIAVVENYLKLILQGYIGLDEQDKVLKKCIVRTCEERQLIDDLLDLGRLDDVDCLHKEPVRLDQVLVEVLKECQEDVFDKRIQISSEIGPDIPAIFGVPELMKSIWCNLVSNALKYTPDGGKISVSIEYLEGWITGSIRDTGIGISEGDQGKLFDEFFRAENARQTSVAGTGLGLVLVKKVVEGLGGNIKVESVLGEGSCFEFSIPVQDDITEI